MKTRCSVWCLVNLWVGLWCVPLSSAAEPEGFKSMFNGRDLTGWVNVNCAPGTFFVKEGEIVTNGNPTGFLRTDRHYENFVLEFEWKHINTKEVGNSGLFVWGDPIPAVGTAYTRGIEVQVLVNLEYKDQKTGAVTATSHGDLFSIWGASCEPERPHPLGWKRCLPLAYHAHGGGEWNHYKVVANNGVIKLTVNGKEVSGVSKCSPRKGYLALESEGAECHFRNLKIKELPSTNPKPEETAEVDKGHKSLFDGLTLEGWEFWTPPGADADEGWKPASGRIVSAGQNFLSTKQKFGPCELVFDWKLPADAAKRECTVFLGGKSRVVELAADAKPGAWQRATLKSEAGVPASIQFVPAPGLEIMNLFVRELPAE
ncbi:MAG: DUF1080 domain-containing protein [Planctomycetes bacterium]|nr:DUF1080 domain-containing protein [Planctomycetota bacterium]